MKRGRDLGRQGGESWGSSGVRKTWKWGHQWCGLLAMDYANLVEEIVVGKGEVENKVRKIAQIWINAKLKTLKEMATHSSVLAWRIPGMGVPGGLPSMGSHRVGHD